MRLKKWIFSSTFVVMMVVIASVSMAQKENGNPGDDPALMGGKMEPAAMGGMMGRMDMKGMGGRMGCPMFGEMMEMNGANAIDMYLRHAGDLGLSDEQVTKLKDMKSAFMKETIEKAAKLQVGRIELRDLMEKDTADMAAIEKKVKENESLRTDLVLSSVKAVINARNVLTPEQRKDARKFLMGQKEGMKKMKGMQKGMPMGEPGSGKQKKHSM